MEVAVLMVMVVEVVKAPSWVLRGLEELRLRTGVGIYFLVLWKKTGDRMNFT